jgi:hypothetical protein
VRRSFRHDVDLQPRLSHVATSLHISFDWFSSLHITSHHVTSRDGSTSNHMHRIACISSHLSIGPQHSLTSLMFNTRMITCYHSIDPNVSTSFWFFPFVLFFCLFLLFRFLPPPAQPPHRTNLHSHASSSTRTTAYPHTASWYSRPSTLCRIPAPCKKTFTFSSPSTKPPSTSTFHCSFLCHCFEFVSPRDALVRCVMTLRAQWFCTPSSL